MERRIAMKARMMVLACATIALVCVTQATAESHDKWIGVWHAKVVNQPGMTLTLADDTGELGGTIVFEVFNRDENRLIAREPHTLVHPHIDGNVLSFQVKGCCGHSQILKMTVELTKDGKAETRCSNCGSDAVTELEKAN
jgi:hypothetical protein